MPEIPPDGKYLSFPRFIQRRPPGDAAIDRRRRKSRVI
jgi:hypothetical protein